MLLWPGQLEPESPTAADVISTMRLRVLLPLSLRSEFRTLVRVADGGGEATSGTPVVRTCVPIAGGLLSVARRHSATSLHHLQQIAIPPALPFCPKACALPPPSCSNLRQSNILGLFSSDSYPGLPGLVLDTF